MSDGPLQKFRWGEKYQTSTRQYGERSCSELATAVAIPSTLPPSSDDRPFPQKVIDGRCEWRSYEQWEWERGGAVSTANRVDRTPAIERALGRQCATAHRTTPGADDRRADEPMTEPDHGDWDDGQIQRWCGECETWVLSIDWMDHYDHGPADQPETDGTADSSDQPGECPPNP